MIVTFDVILLLNYHSRHITVNECVVLFCWLRDLSNLFSVLE